MDKAEATHWVLLGTYLGIKHCCIEADLQDKACTCSGALIGARKAMPVSGMPLDLSARQRAKVQAILQRLSK